MHLFISRTFSPKFIDISMNGQGEELVDLVVKVSHYLIKIARFTSLRASWSDSKLTLKKGLCYRGFE